VAAAIIGGFLLGIAIGPLIARRLTPYIAHVEALVGIVGAAAAVFFMIMGSAPLAWVGGIAGSPLLIALSAGVIISIPALLIGLSLPLFAIYLRYARSDSEDSDGFRVSYLFYNLGAGVCVLLVELLMIHALGISATMLCIAALNLVVAAVLWRFLKSPDEAFFEQERVGHDPLPASILIPLAVSGVISGVFQILYLKVSMHIWGPTTLTVASVITSAFLGIALGSAISGRTRAPLSTVLLLCGLTIAMLFYLMGDIIVLWSYVAQWASERYGYGNLYLFQCAFVVVVGLPVFTLLGSTEPAALTGRSGSVFEGGKVLSISAFANAAGVFLMIFWMHESFKDHFMMIGMSVLFLIIGAWKSPNKETSNA
jgi:hypothetical protein